MIPHLPHLPDQPYLPLVAMWLGMMVVMMGPTVAPWVLAVGRLGGNRVTFSTGYAASWLIYSIAAAAIQVLLHYSGNDEPKGSSLHAGWSPIFTFLNSGGDEPLGSSSMLSALILFTAGAFQFAPLKRACLMHCRNPLTYFLARWRDGSSGGFRMGFHHGLFCVACCWALMATTLAVGVMSLWWMAALALVTFTEQVSPWGDRVRQIAGIGLIAASFIM